MVNDIPEMLCHAVKLTCQCFQAQRWLHQRWEKYLEPRPGRKQQHGTDCLQISQPRVTGLKYTNYQAKILFSYSWSLKHCQVFIFLNGEMWRPSYSGGNIWQSWQEDCTQQARKILQTARIYQELFNDSRTAATLSADSADSPGQNRK